MKIIKNWFGTITLISSTVCLKRSLNMNISFLKYRDNLGMKYYNHQKANNGFFFVGVVQRVPKVSVYLEPISITYRLSVEPPTLSVIFVAW